MDGLINLLVPREEQGRFYGVTVGVVTNIKDPEDLGRVKVKFPWLSDQDESHWARIVTLMAGNQRGMYFLPEVDDEVIVAFEQGDVEFPYILGSLWNGKDKPPESHEDGKNNKRTIKSRSGHIIRLDDTEKSEKIEIIGKSGKTSITFNTKDDDNSITITADADITIKSKNGKLILNGKKGVEIYSGAELKVEAGENMDLKAGPQLNIKGEMVNIN